ncbi:RING-type domain-containing protein [Forsythia ovata]|uniref:RING-type domain-containing protein n=1 Tax=Forsythia ovata TaxID=205694 RepID=A0ABD1UAD1_9LAMI
MEIVAGPPESAAAELDFVVVLAALLCALISVVGLIAVARCAWLHRGGAAGTSRFEGQTSANKGLKKKVLQLFPKFTYDSSSVAAAMTVDCAICLEKYADGDEIRMRDWDPTHHALLVGRFLPWLRAVNEAIYKRHPALAMPSRVQLKLSSSLDKIALLLRVQLGFCRRKQLSNLKLESAISRP